MDSSRQVAPNQRGRQVDLEQDAQAENRQSAAPDVVELIVAKQREGETGTVYLKNKLGFGRVDEMREGYEPPARREIKTKTGWGRKEIDHAV
jgi:hypothetical protein